MFVGYLSKVHNIDMEPDQLGYCKILIYISSVVTACSTYFIVFMTFERFYSIIRPHKAASFNTAKKAKITISCIVIVSVIGNSVWFSMTQAVGRECMIVSDDILSFIFYLLGTIISYLLPFVFVIIMNSFVIYTLRQRSKNNLTRSKCQGQTQGQCQGDKQYQRQIFVMLLLVAFAFVVMTTPVYVTILWQSFYFRPTAKLIATSYFLFSVTDKIYFTNNGINFFLYVMSGQKFRTDLRNLFTVCKSQNSNPQSIRISETQIISTRAG